LSPDSVQGPKELFLLVTIARAKEIVFDASAPFGYRAPRISKMKLKFNAYVKNSDKRVKFAKLTDLKLRVLLTPGEKNGGHG